MTFDAAWYAAVFDAMPEGVIVYDGTGRAVFANQRALDLLGLDIDQVREEAPVDPAWVALHPDGTTRAFDDLPVQRALRAGRAVRQDLHGIRRLDGSVVWLTANVELLADPTPELAAVATFRDTTEVHIGRNVDRALLQTAARLVELPVGDTSVVGDHLADLAALCDADRVLFVAIEHDSGRARVTHDWSRPVEPMPRTSAGVALDLVPRLLGRLARRELVVLDPAAQDEVNAGVRQLLAAWELGGALVAPVVAEDALRALSLIHI